MAKNHWGLIAFGILIGYLTACGQARTDDTRIEIRNALDGASCYVLFQGADAKGVSCK